jgi:HK97 family phage major capsid protein
MSYERIVEAVFTSPWAILPEKLASIVEFIRFKSEGGVFTVEEVRERVGTPQAANEYVVDEGGQIFRAVVDPESGTVVVTAFAAAANGGAKGKLVAVIPIVGTITPKANMMSDISGGTSIEKLTKQFRSAVANPDVRAIVLDIDSPGGSVYGVQELADEIRGARDEKKIVAQVSPLAASAAYWLASQANEIAITPSGDAGSIGVYMAHQDVSKAMELRGVKTTLISAGKYKVEGNPYEPLSDEAMANLQERVTQIYGRFLDDVAAGRGVKASVVRNGFGQGRVLSAQNAKREGLVDRIATLDQTLGRLGAGANGDRIPMTAAADPAVISEKVSAGEQQAGKGVKPANAETHEHDGGRKMEATELVALEQKRADGLKSLAAMHAAVISPAQLTKWLADDNVTVEAAQAMVLKRLQTSAGPATGAQAEDLIDAVPERKSVAALVVADVVDKLPKGISLARALRAYGKHKGDCKAAAKFAETVLHDKVAASALTASSESGGGFLVPENMASDVIELLRPIAVVRSMGVQTAPMINGNIALPKKTQATSASYVGETQNAPATNVKFGTVKGTSKKLAALVPLSNDLMRYQGPGMGIDSLIRDDLATSFAIAEDTAFLRGSGTLFSPKGLRNWCPAANVFATSGGGAAPTLAQVRTSLSQLTLALRKANVRMLRAGWIMSPRIENYLLWSVQDGNGNLVFNREMMEKGTLLNKPYKVTTIIPENLGSGSDSELYLADFADVVIADNPTISIEMSQEASFQDSDGTTISAFQADMTLIRMIVEHDLLVRHPESIAVLTTNLQWA